MNLRILSSAVLTLIVAGPAACSTGPSDESGTGGQGGDGLIGAACEFGDDQTKCGGQEDLVCALELDPTGQACDDDEDCNSGELCFASADGAAEGTCDRIVGACASLPDTGAGLPFGEACDPNATTDPCAGDCVPIGEEGGGECEELCRIGATSGCGEDVIASSDVACAFYAYDLSDAGIEQGAGDLGVCAQFCNCNADCPGQQLCLSAPTDAYLGICAGGIPSEAALEQCPSGAGGAGGGPG